ncbi:hypothetical protein [Collimonas sp.]|jgi:hypothetical protein|uniref:hypothetical protein n=1 Tax=Collimonas sp. TaxID=1963772 RepID=UPI002B618F0C|nr:hypothetical protein [Collimonas sp.]HWW05810.1 hypothetical protein [Collimonas sp.]
MFTFKSALAFSLSALFIANTPAHAAVFPQNLLGLDKTAISNDLEASGYNIEIAEDGFNYRAAYKDRSKHFLDGGFTLCKGKTVSVVIGIDAYAEYEDQLRLLLKRYGQPVVSVRTAEMVDGDIPYVVFEWETSEQRISLDSYPPSKFWRIPTTTRTALLNFLDLKQKCYFMPPRIKGSD